MNKNNDHTGIYGKCDISGAAPGFGRAKMAANFDLSRSTSNSEKYTFRDMLAQKKYTAFVNNVQTLL